EAFNTMLDVVCERDTRLRTLIQTIPDLVWLKDPNGIYLFCNSKFERFFGAREKNIIGKTDYDFVDKKLADFFREKDKAAVAKGNFSINEEEIVYANDGHRELVETIKTPIYDNAGDLIGVLGIARDITKRRQAEKERVKLESQLQQAQKMEAIGTLAGGIAHDFNNLLGVILGFAEMAQDQAPEDSLIHADLDKVLSAGHRAKDLVAQILAFSRQTKSEQIHLHPQPILKEAIKLIRSSIPTTISVEQNIEDGCGAIKADPTQLHQIIMNLCTNSYQAMEEHGGILSITLDRTELTTDDLRDEPSLIPGSYVQLTIADTGPGINPDIQKHIFDPYFTTKEVGKGTGLGLSVVHGIVKNHGGMISADSKVGEGTTFHVFFPELIEMIEENVVAAHSMPTGNERILFVDDERLLADMGKQLLERSGYSVTALTSSREALEMFRAQPDQFDLVITDQTMPGLTGVNLAQAIFAIQQNMPIILCTGYSTTISKKKALAMGIREFVMKPMLKNDIAPLIRKVLDEVKAEKTNKAYDF
ncbi:MAG: response regulator, partial [Desulfobulbaceae bacterium]|nr:response regulator [Desulfobulbaceae bacterium]